MLYYSNGGPGPADKLLRVNVNGDGGDYETWRSASADRWSARGGWEPYPNAQLDIQFLGEYFMVDESEVPMIQAHLQELAGKYRAPLRERHGELPVQRLTKAHIDDRVAELLAGGTSTAKGRTRRPWGADAVNKVTPSIAMVLADAKRQGLMARNVAEHVDRVDRPHKDIDTYTEAEVRQLLSALADDRLAHAWELALSGLRRGEIAGLRWADVDLDAKTLAVANNRVAAGSKTVENDPKSETSRRTLPLPNRLVSVLKAAHKRQAEERLALGAARGPWTYVVCNEAGQPYSPGVLSRYWREAVEAAGLRHIKLHAARHTCATLMHLQGVPVAVIAAWIGHKDASLTMRLYAHSQFAALQDAGASLDRVVTFCGTEGRGQAR